MKTPHKHAEVIKAWADGATIQIRQTNGFWRDLDKQPDWLTHSEYRVKPEVVKYRRFLWQHGASDPLSIGVLNYSIGTAPLLVEALSSFIRWIDTEWQEVEV